MNNFKDFNIKPKINNYVGEKIKIEKILNSSITILDYKIEDSKKKPGTKFMTLQILKGEEKRVVFTGATVLIDEIEQVPKDKFPFVTTIRRENEYYEFS